jgi:hypothetical protein
VSLDAAPVQLAVNSPTLAMVASVQIRSAHGAWRLTADAIHGKVMVANPPATRNCRFRRAADETQDVRL